MKGNEKQKTDDCNLAQHHPPPLRVRPWILGYSWVHLPSSPRWVTGCRTHSLGHPLFPEVCLCLPYFFCFLASSALHCLPFWVPGLGFFPHLPPFFCLRSACLLCAPLACCLPLIVFPLVSPLFCCGWLSLFPPPSLPPSCVCARRRRFGRLHFRFLVILVWRDSCISTTGIKEQIIKWVRSYHPRIDVSEIFPFLSWRRVKRWRWRKGTFVTFLPLFQGLLWVCENPARCQPGENYSSNSNLQNHMDIKQGDCLSCNSGSSMNRLLQVTDTDSGRRIHVPAKIRYGKSVRLFQVFTRSDCTFSLGSHLLSGRFYPGNLKAVTTSPL